MISRTLRSFRIQALVAVVAVAGALLFTGTASADTATGTSDTTTTTTTSTSTSSTTLTLEGIARKGASPGCTVLDTFDGASYELVMPKYTSTTQRTLARSLMYGFPLGVPVQVHAEPLDGVATYCMEGPLVQVIDYTLL